MTAKPHGSETRASRRTGPVSTPGGTISENPSPHNRRRASISEPAVYTSVSRTILPSLHVSTHPSVSIARCLAIDSRTSHRSVDSPEESVILLLVGTPAPESSLYQRAVSASPAARYSSTSSYNRACASPDILRCSLAAATTGYACSPVTARRILALSSGACVKCCGKCLQVV